MPDLKRVGKVWQGQIQADGQHIIVGEDTVVTIKPNNTQKKANKVAEKAAKKQRQSSKDVDAADEEQESGPALERADQIRTNTFVAYEGTRQKDGTILAKKVEFTENELNSGEARLWKMLLPKVKAPNYLSSRPGELQIQRVESISLRLARKCKSTFKR